jgi:hypothetical protein
MTKLKTLKDLDSHAWAGRACYLKDELKQEAIKWVKNEKYQGLYYESMKYFITTFFNLTEDDLK